jgi:hypothetical protein
MAPWAQRVVATALILFSLVFLFRFGVLLLRLLGRVVRFALSFFAVTRGTPYGLAVFVLLVIGVVFAVRGWRKRKRSGQWN